MNDDGISCPGVKSSAEFWRDRLLAVVEWYANPNHWNLAVAGEWVEYDDGPVEAAFLRDNGRRAAVLMDEYRTAQAAEAQARSPNRKIAPTPEDKAT